LCIFSWQEKDMQKLRDAKIQQDMLDREASVRRAKTQAALAEGISWGMAEDAIEESAEVRFLFLKRLVIIYSF
jgi:hypothetical protein